MCTLSYRVGMSVHYKQRVIFLLLLYISCSVIANETEEEKYFEEEDYEYEFYPDGEEDGVIRSIPGDEKYKNNITTPINLPNEHTTGSVVTVTEIPTSTFSYCPVNCECDEDYQFINCSGRNLTQVPRDIPAKARLIDLRYNSISSLDALDFINCSRLREINLAVNRISNIEKELFINLRKLESIDLENNMLKTIDPDTFSEALALVKINLNNNPIRLSENNSFLNQPKLKKLYLCNCTFTHLYDDTFKNLSSLNTLELSGNNLSMTINANAFEPLKRLASLTLPHIEKEHFKRLCEVLPSIDVINTKEYNVSCFELVSGTSFEESITEGKKTLLNIPKSNSQNFTSKHGSNKTKSKENIVTTLSAPTLLELSEETGTGIHSNKEINNGTAKDDTTKETYQVQVSSETINHILIAIIIIAIVGLAVGMLCRKDICGMKTKLCRTRRPAPTDQVRPAEEVPLNKV